MKRVVKKVGVKTKRAVSKLQQKVHPLLVGPPELEVPQLTLMFVVSLMVRNKTSVSGTLK